AKRTTVEEYRTQNRGGFGIKVANLPEARGELVGAEIVVADSEVLVVMESGNVVRSAVEQVPIRGRDTMGVIFASPGKKDRIVGATLNYEIEELEDDAEEGDEIEETDTTDESTVQDQVSSDTDLDDEGEQRVRLKQPNPPRVAAVPRENPPDPRTSFVLPQRP